MGDSNATVSPSRGDLGGSGASDSPPRLQPGGSGSCSRRRRTSCSGLPRTLGAPPLEITLETLAFFRLPSTVDNRAWRLDVGGWGHIAAGHDGDAKDAATAYVAPSCNVRRPSGESIYLAYPPFVVSATDNGTYQFRFDGGGTGFAALSFANCGDTETSSSSDEIACFGGESVVAPSALWSLHSELCYLVRWGSQGPVDAVFVEWVGPVNETHLESAMGRARLSGTDALATLAGGIVSLFAVLIVANVVAYFSRRRPSPVRMDRVRRSGLDGSVS